MLDVHRAGSGVAGVYTFDIAATKKNEAERLAADGGHPLLFTLSEEGPYET
jgi:ATP-dependent Clp protease adaptor protein ClpS